MGPAGLVIATPLTACIKVIGDYIPSLDFFSLLLGADVALEDHHDYYRKLLELDRQDAQALAIRYCDEHGLEATFKEIFSRALQLAGQEFEDGHLSSANQQFIIDTTRELIADLGSRFSKPRLPAPFHVLGVCAPGESHSLGLMIVLELLRLDGIAASFAGENKSLSEIRDFVNRYTPDLICLSGTLASNVPAAITNGASAQSREASACNYCRWPRRRQDHRRMVRCRMRPGMCERQRGAQGGATIRARSVSCEPVRPTPAVFRFACL